MEFILKYSTLFLNIFMILFFIILIISGKLKNGEINILKGVFKFNNNKDGFIQIDKDKYIENETYINRNESIKLQMRVAKDEVRRTTIKQLDYFAGVFKINSENENYKSYAEVVESIRIVALNKICKLIENNGFAKKDMYEWQVYKETNRDLIWEDCMNVMRSKFPLYKFTIKREEIAEFGKPTFRQMFVDGLYTILEQCKIISIEQNDKLNNIIGGLND